MDQGAGFLTNAYSISNLQSIRIPASSLGVEVILSHKKVMKR